ncbi:hypothetical protein IMG5_110630 [Ichthyophthirius multifiliis]|uniref:Uncharacterized protein n=1 Tax=Ichthyophthirius multifiliis TaxID=5932 RepID=G0QTQ5_ICHMU|nr:hypothetical protein IMG5_110630 [Ichthyophthirius multifiliis]EGR31404.1 hypothetical protein IMG5_110630 [Ichthyophthirius multifiliis]|eukprot:XP_004034890.1 hypothetical protein IMG5_110630 [Ichthyophthirius multifiliis]
MEELKQKLNLIFHFYSSFGDRQNITYLKSAKFSKLMQDSQIISSQINSKTIDIIYSQNTQNKQNMTFQKFIDTLPIISQLKYPTETAENAFKKLINTHLNPIYEFITTKTDLGLELQKFQQPIFEQYFTLNYQEQCFFTFQLLNLKKHGKKDIGTVFTFNCFLNFLIFSAQIVYQQDTIMEISVQKKVELLLEKMQFSEGFQNIQKKTNKTNNSKTILTSSFKQKMNENIEFQSTYSNCSSSYVKQNIYTSFKTKDSFFQIEAFLPQEQKENLHQIFLSYCSQGEPMNISTLKIFKLIRFLTDMNIINENKINKNFIEIQVAKLTGPNCIKQIKKTQSNSIICSQSPILAQKSYLENNMETQGTKGKIEFEHFLKLLQIISENMYPNESPEQALRILIEENIFKYVNNNKNNDNIKQNKKNVNYYLQILMDVLKDQDIVTLLGEIHINVVVRSLVF